MFRCAIAKTQIYVEHSLLVIISTKLELGDAGDGQGIGRGVPTRPRGLLRAPPSRQIEATGAYLYCWSEDAIKKGTMGRTIRIRFRLPKW